MSCYLARFRLHTRGSDRGEGIDGTGDGGKFDGHSPLGDTALVAVVLVADCVAEEQV